MEALRSAADAVPAEVPVELQAFETTSPATGLGSIVAAREADLLVLGPTQRGTLTRAVGGSTVQRVLGRAPCAIAVAVEARDRHPGDRPRVLVAYDGSPPADVALETAFALVEPRRGTVRICAAATAEPKAEVWELLDRAARGAPEGVAVERRVLTGDPADAILREAEKGFDLLVTGSRHHALPHRAITGSVSARLLKDGRVPVLATPKP
jgi:nucleotide-binding universal stress UspA family protein